MNETSRLVGGPSLPILGVAEAWDVLPRIGGPGVVVFVPLEGRATALLVCAGEADEMRVLVDLESRALGADVGTALAALVSTLRDRRAERRDAQ